MEIVMSLSWVKKKEEEAKHKAEVEEANRRAEEELKKIAKKEQERREAAEKAKKEQEKQETEKEVEMAVAAIPAENDDGQKTEMLLKLLANK